MNLLKSLAGVLITCLIAGAALGFASFMLGQPAE